MRAIGWLGLALADEVGALGGVGVVLAHPERNAERLAHLVARPLVIGVRVGDGVGGHGVALELAEDAPPRVPGAGIDEHVLEEEDVDAVRRKAGELPDTLRELLHRAAAYVIARGVGGLRVLSHISFAAPSLRSGGQSVLCATRRRIAAADTSVRAWPRLTAGAGAELCF